jgi:hypothetical protein
MSKKITYDALLSMLRNVDIPDVEIAPYLEAVPSNNGAFSIQIVPNPEMVMLTEDDKKFESFLTTANGISRWRRSVKFNRNIKNSKYQDWPVLVSEGDSWFQFPVLIEDIIDHLSNGYLINCLGAAGDTAENMVTGPLRTGGQEGRLQGFLFSAAGNDVIGQDPNTKESILARHLKEGGDESNPQTFIDMDQFRNTINKLEGYYKTVITNIRQDATLKKIPIFIHGYDYCFPGGHDNDPRKKPSYAKLDEWLGSAFKQKRILLGQRDKQRDIIVYMIDSLYEMMLKLEDDNIHVVDVRKTLQNIEDWKDEIHGTSEGFKSIAEKFKNEMKKVIV